MLAVLLAAAVLCTALLMGCDNSVLPRRPSAIQSIESKEPEPAKTPAPSASPSPVTAPPQASASPTLPPDDPASLLQETTQEGPG
ncbi:MAG TPA: hypothetical protein DEB31_10415, partial [Clostridiales bacterium]|nr:hypothetical protein [Clostridiales bacterium]